MRKTEQKKISKLVKFVHVILEKSSKHNFGNSSCLFIELPYDTQTVQLLVNVV